MSAPGFEPMDMDPTKPAMVPARRRLRRILNLAGILPALLVLLFTVKVVLMLSHSGDGHDRYAADDFDAAAAEFTANRRLNLLESWIAPFDEGVARHAEGEYDDAVAAYIDALEDVPAEEECTVRINLALAQEALGDAAIEMPDRAAALEAWQAGVDALAEGGCPEDSGRGADQTADAKAVDERLRQKIEEQQPEQQQPLRRPHQQPEQSPEQQRKEERLEQRNQRGSTERQEREQNDGDIEFGEGQQW